jgi:lysozyme
MIKGIDVSHWQNDIDWKKVAKDGVEFAILKATEAVGYVDPKLEENYKEARKQGILLGFYHFARGGDAHQEADFFLSKIPKLQRGEFLVLDYEINIVKEVEWCRKFLDRVFDRTGIRPILYTNEARVTSINWQYVIDGNYGLWVAKYGVNNGDLGKKPNIGQWPFAVIWQYTSKGKVDGIEGNVDLNMAFADDVDTLAKYGAQTDEYSQDNDKITGLKKELEEEKKKNNEVIRQLEEKTKEITDLKNKLGKIQELAKY